MPSAKTFSRSQSLLGLISSLGYRGTIGSLRLKATLGNSASYIFQTVANVGTQKADEIRVQPNDAFIPLKVAMYIQKVASTDTDSDNMIGIDRTYPNPLIFTGANEAANLEGLYHGKLIFNVNSVNLIETMDTLQFRRVDTAQQLVQQGSGAGAAGVYQRDGWNGGDYGFVPLTADLAFNGQDKGTVQLNLNNIAINAAGTASVNYAVLQFRGISLLNGAQVFKDKTVQAFMTKQKS